jgi:hypothetical protein
LNVREKLVPDTMFPESHIPVSLVDVWVMPELLVQVTVSPTLMVMFLATNMSPAVVMTVVVVAAVIGPRTWLWVMRTVIGAATQQEGALSTADSVVLHPPISRSDMNS